MNSRYAEMLNDLSQNNTQTVDLSLNSKVFIVDGL